MERAGADRRPVDRCVVVLKLLIDLLEAQIPALVIVVALLGFFRLQRLG